MLKKGMALLIAVSLTASLFAGCGDEKEPAAQSSTAQTSASGTAQETKPEEKITIKWRGSPNYKSIEKDSPTEKYLEEKFNVNIDAIAADDTKLGAMIASNDIPDVMYITEPTVWQPLVDQGVLAEVPMDVIKNNAPKHYARIQELDPRIWAVSGYKGKNWAVPQEIGAAEYTGVAVWRQDWLEKLGITKVPETIKEYEDAFIKLRNNDPDGNGKKDTYGLTGQGGHPVRQFDFIFGAYGIMPGQWRVVDGKVIMSTIMPEAKEVLTLLNDWYSKELIDPEFITDTPGTFYTKFDAGRYGFVFANISQYSEYTAEGRAQIDAWKKRDPNAKLTFGTLPIGPNGNKGSWLWGPRKNFVCFGVQVGKDLNKMGKILSIADAINYEEEPAVRTQWGEKGKTYDFIDAAKGAAGGLKYIVPYDTDSNARMKEGIADGVNFFNLLQPSATWAVADIWKKYINPDFIAQNEKLANSGQARDALMRPNLPSAVKYSANLDKLKSVAYSEFIIGKRSLNDWDKFVQEWLDNGGKALTEEAQKFYDENVKPYEKK